MKISPSLVFSHPRFHIWTCVSFFIFIIMAAVSVSIFIPNEVSGSSCSDFSGSQGTCEAHAGCTYPANLGACSTYNGNQVTCESTSGCTYPGNAGNCSGLDTTPCVQTAGCSWNSGSSCSNFNGDSGSCNANTGCTWDSASCSAFDNNSSACGAAAGCTYPGNAGDCSVTYNHNESGCSGATGCSVNTSNTCSAQTDATSCSNAGCTPANDGNCGSFNDGGGDGASCATNGLGQCSYDNDTGVCSGSYFTSCSGDNSTCTGGYDTGVCTGSYNPGTCSGTYGASCTGNFDDGTCAGSFDNGACTGSYDGTAPSLQSAATNAAGNTITLTYDENLGGTSLSTSQFTVFVNSGSGPSVSSADVSGATVVLTLGSGVGDGTTVTLSYTPGGSLIEDTAGNDATSLSSQSVTNNSDIATPTLSSAVTNTSGNTITLTYDENLGGTSLSTSQFEVIVNGGTGPDVNSATVSGTTVVLTLASSVGGGTVVLNYNPNVDTPIEDLSGNDAAPLNGRSVTNNTDATPPSFQSAVTSVSGTSITLTYDENLGGTSLSTSQFTVFVNGFGLAVNSADVSGSTVVLSLASSVGDGTTVTLSYDSYGGTIHDLVGNNAVFLSNEIVTNNSDTTGPSLSFTTPATNAYIDNVTSSSDITYTLGENIPSGSLTITRTSGESDYSSPHTCTLKGTALNSGAHTLNLSDTTNSCTGNVSNLVSGTVYTFAFVAADGHGNDSSVTMTDVTFDNTAPSAPGTPDMTYDTDSGSVNSDDITNDTTPDFTISCETGATVTLKEGGTTLGTGTCVSSTVTITSSTLSSGSHTLKAIQTDLTQNISSDSSTLSVTIDATVPVISSVTPANSASVGNVTSPSDITYTLSEALDSGSVTITRTSGTTDASSPHTCTLNGTALNSGAHTLNLSDTANNCVSDVALVPGTVYTFVFAGTDLAGNSASSVTRTGVTFDTTVPTITSVSSDKAAGSYKAGEVIDIDVTFSEAVTSTGNVTVTLETGVTDRTCTFSVSNSATGTCNYTVQAGDVSSDLNVNTISGTIADAAGNTMSDFTPATNLAANEALVIDTTSPVISEVTPVTTPTSDSSPDYIFTTSEAGLISYGGSCSSATTGASSGSNTITLNSLADGTYSNCTITVSDAPGNISNTLTITSFTVSTSIGTPPAEQTPTTNGGWRTGGSSGGGAVFSNNIPSAPPATPAPTPLNEAIKTLVEFIPSFLKPEKPSPPQVIPIPATSEPQPVFVENWDLIPSSSINRFVLNTLPSEITDLTKKFPELGRVFTSIGVNNIGDLGKLQDITLNLPKISDKTNPPTEVVFAKTDEGNIPISTSLNIGESGSIEQKIHTLGNSSVTLQIKPEGQAKSIKGYMKFKRKAEVSIMNMPTNSLVASAIIAVGSLGEESQDPTVVKEDMLVFEFEYTDPDGDGIYTADIKTPQVEGTYEIVTVIDYKDAKLASKKQSMITVIDPEGYIYELDGRNREIRIEGAKVSIFQVTSNGDTLWNAEKYSQDNPQTTERTGKYAFLVPEGKYFITVESKGYDLYKGEVFDVKEGNPVHHNIELVKSRAWLYNLFDWKMGIIIIILTIYATSRFERRRAIKKLKSL